MKPQALIHHKLTLVISLRDATTGKEVYENDVMFHMPPNIRAPISKRPGVFIFINLETSDFDFQVDVHGYEPVEVKVRSDSINENLPMRDVFLIPYEYPRGRYETLALKGRMENLQEIGAISLTEPVLSVKKYDERKKELSLMNQHRAELSAVHLGLYNESQHVFDVLDVEKDISKQLIKLRSSPEHGCEINQPIMRIVFGQVKQDGSYLLKVLDRDPAEYLVRFVVDGKPYYQRIDMSNPEPLKEGGDVWDTQ